MVTRQPLKVQGLELENLTKKDVTEVDIAKVREAQAALKNTPGEWAEHHVEMTTVAPAAAPAPKLAKRIGLFVGVGKYVDPNIRAEPACPNGARTMAEVMKCIADSMTPS